MRKPLLPYCTVTVERIIRMRRSRPRTTGTRSATVFYFCGGRESGLCTVLTEYRIQFPTDFYSPHAACRGLHREGYLNTKCIVNVSGTASKSTVDYLGSNNCWPRVSAAVFDTTDVSDFTPNSPRVRPTIRILCICILD